MVSGQIKPIRKVHKTGKESDTLIGLFFIFPFIALWFIWFFLPFMQSFIRSFQDANFISLEDAKFIGLTNYINILKDPEFHSALLHSVIIVAVSVPAITILSLLIALAVNQNIMAKGLFRTIYVVPYITSPIAAATVFMVLFRKDNLMAKAMSVFGFPNTTWFSDVNLALFFVIILFVWWQVGFFVIIYLAGLQDVPKELYEAATVDGAGTFRRFLNITVPSLKPVTFFVVTVVTIYAFQIYDQVAAISRYGVLGQPAGRTTTIITYFIQHGIRYMEIGYGCAAVVIFTLIILAVTFIQKILIGKED
ncbi:MAG TPA: sugar ABC transporter permease [Clostridiaceae bacterium]|nr:sugar ABC transporter permease [Clostridiaceae bacterium]